MPPLLQLKVLSSVVFACAAGGGFIAGCLVMGAYFLFVGDGRSSEKHSAVGGDDSYGGGFAGG